MSKESDTAISTGVGSANLLGILFVALKLLHVIDWSWWWVTLPFWGGLALVFFLVLVILIFVAIVDVIK